jgi:hypothetical protein
MSAILARLSRASNEQLAEILFDLVGQTRCYNFKVVAERWCEDDHMLELDD